MTATGARYFRYRPVLVEARQVNPDDWDTVENIAEWCGGDALDMDGFVAGHDDAVIFVPDTDGDEVIGSYAETGDWIVRGRDGTYDVYAPDAFEATFEPVVQL